MYGFGQLIVVICMVPKCVCWCIWDNLGAKVDVVRFAVYVWVL